MQVDSTPFERRMRARALGIYAILAYIATIVGFFILQNFLPAWFTSQTRPASRGYIRTYAVRFLFPVLLSECCLVSGLSYRRLFGAFPGWGKLVRYNLWVVPLVILSIGTTYLLFFPLSFLFPRLVKVWLIDLYPTLVWTSGDNYVLANLLNLFVIVIVCSGI